MAPDIMALPFPDRPSDPTPADDALVDLIRAGDERAFEVLFRRYQPMLLRVAARYNPLGIAADDLVQEVFLKIWRTREQWNPGESAKGYLLATTRNAALNAGRRGALERRWFAPNPLERTAAASDPAPTPDASLEHAERRAELARVVAQMPPRAREAFLLRYRDDLSYADIARVMGLSVKTISHHLGAAYQILRRVGLKDP